MTDKEATRREFLAGLARGGALTGLAALAVVLGRRGRAADRDAHRCVNQGACRGCAALDRCLLPQAASARQQGPAVGESADGGAPGGGR